MTPKRIKDFRLDSLGVIVLLPLLLIPVVSTSNLVFSLTNQIAIGITAAMAVYIMLRMNLLSFTVPSFMAVGGYTAALLSTNGVTNLVVLLVASFVVPMLVAIPIGVLVLRLRGVYFIFFTFILNEVLQVAIFETPTLTGGSNGIAGVPNASLFGVNFATPALIVTVTVVATVLAAIATLAVTQRFRPEFSAIEENETLSASLGVAVWKYRSIGFMASAGVAGLAGFALVHQLSTAHPSSFGSMSAINYVAYAFVGGKGTLLGPIVGAALLIYMSNVFSSQGEFAAALFGILLIAAVMIAPGGIVGLLRRALARVTGGR
ncbi:MAG: branched-chain amino acid ABC transporter permease [Rhodobacteraceae bacterium]|nr:branched-chain amino acid ABC transporter permease [Paracoccaceae bacterium]